MLFAGGTLNGVPYEGPLVLGGTSPAPRRSTAWCYRAARHGGRRARSDRHQFGPESGQWFHPPVLRRDGRRDQYHGPRGDAGRARRQPRSAWRISASSRAAIFHSRKARWWTSRVPEPRPPQATHQPPLPSERGTTLTRPRASRREDTTGHRSQISASPRALPPVRRRRLVLWVRCCGTRKAWSCQPICYPVRQRDGRRRGGRRSATASGLTLERSPMPAR